MCWQPSRCKSCLLLWIYLSMADPRIVFCIVAICTLGVCAGFQCTSAGKFIDPDNCHNYYICDSSLKATAHSCNIFGHFDPSVQRCVMGSDCAGAVVVTTVAPRPGYTTGSPSTGFQCTAPGRFKDPNQCHDFYICDANLQPTHKSCNEFGYFDENSGYCVIGNCPENHSTSAPDGQFMCPSDGFFADPKDCRAYYTCKYGVAVHGMCNGGGGHFDKQNSGCVPGGC